MHIAHIWQYPPPPGVKTHRSEKRLRHPMTPKTDTFENALVRIAENISLRFLRDENGDLKTHLRPHFSPIPLAARSPLYERLK